MKTKFKNIDWSKVNFQGAIGAATSVLPLFAPFLKPHQRIVAVSIVGAATSIAAAIQNCRKDIQGDGAAEGSNANAS